MSDKELIKALLKVKKQATSFKYYAAKYAFRFHTAGAENIFNRQLEKLEIAIAQTDDLIEKDLHAIGGQIARAVEEAAINGN